MSKIFRIFAVLTHRSVLMNGKAEFLYETIIVCYFNRCYAHIGNGV